LPEGEGFKPGEWKNEGGVVKESFGGFLLGLGLALCLLGYGGPAQAAILEVPSIDYPTIQSAISAAVSGMDTVLVHDGTYMENINFWGKKGITVRSKNGAGVTIINGSTPLNPDNGSVVTFSGGEDSTSVLEGFTITGGTGTVGAWDFTYGGGIYCKGATSSPTITNCIITGNTADGGGGIWGSNLTKIEYCTISNNMAGQVGGGVHCSCSAMIFNCTINNNTSSGGGGGISSGVSASWVSIINCTISGNTAAPEYGGGGISASANGSLVVTNCIISGNIAGIGGGISCDWYTLLAVTNCTISGNSATYADPDFQGGGIFCRATSPPTVVNSILWGNSPQQILLNDSTIIVTYSDVQGGWLGEGDINDNPSFAGGGDYHLQPTSPCIDKGNNNAPNLPSYDFDGDPRVFDGDSDGNAIVDMGADEFFIDVCEGDFDRDKDVDGSDLAIFAAWTVRIWLYSLLTLGELTVQRHKVT
jgi:hypothetical protein